MRRVFGQVVIWGALLACAQPGTASARAALLSPISAQAQRLAHYSLVAPLEWTCQTDVRLLEGVDLGGGMGAETRRAGIGVSAATLAGVLGAILGGVGGGIGGFYLATAIAHGDSLVFLVGVLIFPALGVVAGAVVLGITSLLIAGLVIAALNPPEARQTMDGTAPRPPPPGPSSSGAAPAPEDGSLSPPPPPPELEPEAAPAGPPLPLNTINFSPVAALFGFYSLEYERVVAPSWSVFGAPVVQIHGTSLWGGTTTLDTYGLNAGGRVFFTPSAPIGLFLQPQLHAFVGAGGGEVDLQAGIGAQIGAAVLFANRVSASVGVGGAVTVTQRLDLPGAAPPLRGAPALPRKPRGRLLDGSSQAGSTSRSCVGSSGARSHPAVYAARAPRSRLAWLVFPTSPEPVESGDLPGRALG